MASPSPVLGLSINDDEPSEHNSSPQSSDQLTDEQATSFRVLPEYCNNASGSLAAGVRKKFLSDIDQAKSRVKELVHNQDVLRESLQQEMTNLNEYKLTDDIAEFISDLKTYHARLLNIKKDIHQVNDKVSKMKKKAVKLKIGKQKEELHKAHQKQKEMELQKQLTAKPAAGSFSD